MPSTSREYAREYYLKNKEIMKAQMKANYESKTHGSTLVNTDYYKLFSNADISRAFEDRQPKSAVLKGELLCDHKFTETPSLDSAGFENVCSLCGALLPTQIDEGAKLAGCLSLDEWNKDITYGPPTPVFLQSFLVPTFRRIACRDRYLDVKILGKLRVYTSLQRVCDQHNIPRSYADETMRILLVEKKGLYSKYIPIQKLIRLLHESEPRLHNRIPQLELLLVRQSRAKNLEAPLVVA